MKQITLKEFIIISLAFILLLTFIFNLNISRSGAHKILRDNGTISFTTIYKNDTLFYTDNDSILSKQELKALNTQIEYYTLVLK